MTPAWRVAAALALACRLDWGRWAAGLTVLRCTCSTWGTGARLVHTSCPHHGREPDPVVGAAYRDGPPKQRPTPVPDPFNVDAYLADCAFRGVEPGPLPSLSWTSEDGRAGWEVTEVVVRVSAGWAGFWRHLDGPEWFFDFGATDGGRGSSAADLALLSTLVTAAAAALEHDHG